MNYKQATGRSIQDAFERYHKLNPHVYEYFKKFAFEAINKGKRKISFKLIMNVIRWDVYLNTEDDTEYYVDLFGKKTKFKINDAYGSRYARLFVLDYPQYLKMIEFRDLRS